MELVVKKSNKNEIIFNEKKVYFLTKNIFEIGNINEPKSIVKSLIHNDESFNGLQMNFVSLNAIFNYSIGKITKKELNLLLRKEDFSYVLILSIDKKIEEYRNIYDRLSHCTFDNITIYCDKKEINNSLILANSLSEKKVIIKSINISLGDFYKTLKKLDVTKYNKNNIVVDFEDSSELMSIPKLFNVCKDVKLYADKIANFNLSNLEKTMYVYDLVKERLYKESKKDLGESRDIDKVIFGNHITCVGYARLMKSILSFLGINSKVVVSKEKNHAMCLTYLKDKNYNIDGFFAFDPTSDSRKEKEKEEYINKYHFFAVPVSSMNKSIPIEELIKIDMPLDELLISLENKEDTITDSGIKNSIISFFKLMEDNFDFDYLDNESKQYAYEKYDIFRRKLFNSHITIDDFIKALYKVRRLEYYNEDVPSIDIEDIREATIRWYYNLKGLSNGIINSKVNLLNYAICHEYLEDNDERVITSTIPGNTSTKKDKYNLELIKVLKRKRNILSNDSKTENEEQ